MKTTAFDRYYLKLLATDNLAIQDLIADLQEVLAERNHLEAVLRSVAPKGVQLEFNFNGAAE